MPKRPINYTSRDFEAIKSDLVNYVKRYYPSTFKDFNEASFGSMMLDLVAYVGDQLSFYVDYQANESFLDTAIEYKNVAKIARQMGYKFPGSSASQGVCSFYIIIPASPTSLGPDLNYVPILSRGSTFSSGGGAVYTLEDSVDFSNPNSLITVATVDPDTGVPSFYAIKATGKVKSGTLSATRISVGDYQRFRRIQIPFDNITEIVTVVDAQGNEYFEVDYLSQDTVFTQESNYESDKDVVPYIMKVKPVPRRFVTEFDAAGNCFLQFGYGSAENVTKDLIVDPADVVMNMNGRNYVTDKTFDPSNLIESDKFGLSPTDTTLTISYRENPAGSVNASIGSISQVIGGNLNFSNESSLSSAKASSVKSSLEVENEEAIIGDTSVLTTEDIRQRAFSSYASQGRAVTRDDYVSICYRMPKKFGSIKRVNILQDSDTFKRNLNLYILGESPQQKLMVTNRTLKDNLSIWLNKYRMMNDTVDILDGTIINYGIEFEILADKNINRYTVLQSCVRRLQEVTEVTNNFGEPISVTNIYQTLNKVDGVIDTHDVKIVNKAGGIYSEISYDMDANISNDGRMVMIPENAVAEILAPSNDIKGVVR
jgi:hypothetical protein